MLLAKLLLVVVSAGIAFGSAKALAQQTGIAFDGQLVEAGGGSQLELKFDIKPDYRLFFMENPLRFVIETNGIAFALPDEFGKQSTNLVSRVRYGTVTEDRSRLVLSLNGPAEITHHELKKTTDTGRNILTLQIGKTSREKFSNSLQKQVKLMGLSGQTVVKGGRVRPAPKRQGVFTIVIDAGHGGIDGGSEGRKKGVVEKHITLSVAKMLGKILEESDKFHIAYTRDSDTFVSLRERQAIAQRENADLMISLHADSLRQKYVRGATVYTLADKASDALAQQVAESENLADLVAGLAASEESDVVSDILADLTLRETTHFSRAFAAMLIRKMKKRIHLINNPHRAASFAVLKNAEVPSVLLELGYLSNAEDERLMADPNWQVKAASIIGEAVVDYFNRHGSQLTAN